MWQRVWKPWFVYRPSQLVRRLVQPPPAPGWQPIRTSWGVKVIADPAKTIGRSIRTTGVYDLAVTEILTRLIDTGDAVVDAGANVGYMTLAAAVAAGPQGRVRSFEPHPDLFAVLERNVAAASRAFEMAPVLLHNVALGDEPGTADLVLPDDFASNDGVSRIATGAAPPGRSIAVPVATLDDALGDEPVRLLKLDVEGFEARVLEGGMRALESGRVAHVVFEDHDIARSEVVPLLQRVGYRVFAIGWAMRGLVLSPADEGPLAAVYEAPNFVATIDPAELAARCRPGGWLSLRNRTIRR